MIHLRYLGQPPLNGADDTVEIIGVTRNVHNSDVDNVPFPEITVPYTLNGEGSICCSRRACRRSSWSARPARRCTRWTRISRSRRCARSRVDRRMVVRAAKVQPGVVRDLRGPRPAARDDRRLRRDLLRRVASDAGIRRARRARRAEGRHSADGARHGPAARGDRHRARLHRGGGGGTAAGAQIWGVSPYDPLSFGVVIALLLVVGFQACLWPARRAAKVDPMVSLRQS